MLWVEQPVGVGFTQGAPDIVNEVQLAEQFMGFFKNWVDDFQAQGSKVYITGESYGGYYVPYVAEAFINSNDTDYYNLAGVSIIDPILGDGDLQQEGERARITELYLCTDLPLVPVVPYINYWANVFGLNETFRAAVQERSDSCGYTDYINTYLMFPPPGPLPLPKNSSDNCDVFGDVFAAALEVNPCFNIYHILDTCPHLFNVLGIVNQGDYFPTGAEVYFNRSDVQEAINAPVGTDWKQCTNINVFGGPYGNNSQGDQSLGPAQDGVLAHVIESINNTIIGVGGLDYLLPINGTLLALQNVTWNGLQGFQTPPDNDFFVPYHPEYNGGALAGAGVLGQWVTERGLTFYTVDLAGHGKELTVSRIDNVDVCQNYPNTPQEQLTERWSSSWGEYRPWVSLEISPRRVSQPTFTGNFTGHTSCGEE